MIHFYKSICVPVDKVKMAEYFEEDDKDAIEVLYDSNAVKKEVLNDIDKKDMKELEEKELEMMAKQDESSNSIRLQQREI